MITVLLPTYNSEKYISQAIKSILNQTCKNFEFLIIDDGSNDKTEGIVNSLNDKRIKYLYKKHSGLADTLNFGLKHSKYDWIARMDADDISHPQRLELQTNFLTVHNEIDWISCWYGVFDDNKLKYVYKLPEYSEEIVKNLTLSSSICFAGSIFNRKKIVEHGGFRCEVFEDYELLLRVKNQINFYNIPRVLYYQRRRQDSLSKGGLEEKKQIIYKIQAPSYKDLTKEFGINKKEQILAIKGWREYFYGDRSKSLQYWFKMGFNLFHKPTDLLGLISLIAPESLVIYTKKIFFRILLFYSPFISAQQKQDFSMIKRKFIKNNRFLLFGVPLSLLKEEELMNIVNNGIAFNKKSNILALDFRHFLLIKQNKLKILKNNSMIYYPDSSGIYFLLKIFYKKEIEGFERLVSTDFHFNLLALAEKKQYRIYLLGDTKETLKTFTKKNNLNYNNIQITGYADGFDDIKKTDLVKKINDSNPDILLIGLGVPEQEIWLFKNSSELNVPVRITVGAFFTFYSERIKRAPLIFRKFYLEWFYRFMREPQRLFNRYFIQFSKVFFLFLREKWLK